MRKSGQILLVAGVIVYAAAKCPWIQERIREFMMSRMSKKMPGMMEKCMAQMDPEERRRMLAECRSMLDDMEGKLNS